MRLCKKTSANLNMTMCSHDPSLPFYASHFMFINDEFYVLRGYNHILVGERILLLVDTMRVVNNINESRSDSAQVVPFVTILDASV